MIGSQTEAIVTFRDETQHKGAPKFWLLSRAAKIKVIAPLAVGVLIVAAGIN
jgi:hypothetical protein